MDPDYHRGYAFGDFVLDLDRCALLRSGRDTGLEPRHVHVLALLVEHQGTTVTREQILHEVWQDAPPDVETLDRCVEEIESAISEGRAESGLSIASDGFRFDRSVEPLEELAIAPTLGKRHHREPFALGLIALIVLLFIFLWLTDSSQDAPEPETPVRADP